MAKESIGSTLLERAIPRARRAQFARELVWHQLEEINCLGDRLRYLAGQGQADSDEAADVERRLQVFLEALRWNRDEVEQLTWQYAEQPFEQPEDAFAPAVVLKALSSDRHRFARWIDSLPPESFAALVPVALLQQRR